MWFNWFSIDHSKASEAKFKQINLLAYHCWTSEKVFFFIYFQITSNQIDKYIKRQTDICVLCMYRLIDLQIDRSIDRQISMTGIIGQIGQIDVDKRNIITLPGRRSHHNIEIFRYLVPRSIFYKLPISLLSHWKCNCLLVGRSVLIP